MSLDGGQHIFGSYGLIRGYGPLCRTLKEADDNAFDDARVQRRRHGGTSDRNAVLVDTETGLCWWLDADDEGDRVQPEDLVPVKTANGQQARYELEEIRKQRLAWHGPAELAGFG